MPGPGASAESTMKSLHGEDHGELSPALVELKERPLREQGAWWREAAARLAPFGMENSGGVFSDYDHIGQYFNGTSKGLNFVIDRAKGAGAAEMSQFLDDEALAYLFVAHFGFLANCTNWREALAHEGFLSLCRTLGAHDGAKASQASVRYAVRRLRIGGLLHLGVDKQNLYHYDYDCESISGSFVPPMMDEKVSVAASRVSRKMSDSQPLLSQPLLRMQKSIMDEEDLASNEDLSQRIDEYLFCNPYEWPGKVHWVHAHKPTKLMVLALGQQHHLRIHAQGVLCSLQAVYPQHNFGHARQGSGSPDWLLLSFPAVVLDDLAQRSLQNFQKWERDTVAKARRTHHVGVHVGLRTPHSSCSDDERPPVHVGVLTYPAALLWSAPNAHDTVISMSGDAEYVSKWTNEVAPEPLARRLNSILCCQRRKRRQDGYEVLSQDEKDIESSTEESLAVVHKETSCIEDQAAHEGSFERTFEEILFLLAETNSLLRTGTHAQLACRILLNWTSAYSEVVQLYKAAITSMQHHLAQKDHHDKENMIGKISIAKVEISGLMRSLDPFVRYVMPDFHNQLSEGAHRCGLDFSQTILTHHLEDIETNLREAMQELEAQRTLCDSIIEEYERRGKDKVNNILNFLMIITILVIPVNIVTRVYAMNFEAMPELKWKYGYPHWFACTALICSLVFLKTVLYIYRSMI